MVLEDTCVANLEIQNQQEQMVMIITPVFPKVSSPIVNHSYKREHKVTAPNPTLFCSGDGSSGFLDIGSNENFN
jgi:hypothetical protein